MNVSKTFPLWNVLETGPETNACPNAQGRQTQVSGKYNGPSAWASCQRVYLCDRTMYSCWPLNKWKTQLRRGSSYAEWICKGKSDWFQKGKVGPAGKATEEQVGNDSDGSDDQIPAKRSKHTFATPHTTSQGKLEESLPLGSVWLGNHSVMCAESFLLKQKKMLFFMGTASCRFQNLKAHNLSKAYTM